MCERLPEDVSGITAPEKNDRSFSDDLAFTNTPLDHGFAYLVVHPKCRPNLTPFPYIYIMADSDLLGARFLFVLPKQLW